MSLMLEETAMANKGRVAAGLARHWNGRLGKSENSQVTVTGATSAGDRAMVVDLEWFWPEA